LRCIFKDKEIPNPVEYIITRWSSEPFTYGAFTFPAFGCTNKDIHNISRPIKNRIFFGGEGSSIEYMGYLNGAYETGILQANKIKCMLEQKN